jgi:PAS domain S-box-containing protein
MPSRRVSIKSKLTGLSVLTSSLALLLACSGFFAFDLITFRSNIVRNLSTQADIIGINSASALLFHDPKAANETLSALKARSTIEAAAIYTPDGRPFALWTTGSTAIPSLQSLTVPKRTGHHFDFSSLTLLQPIVFDGANIGSVYIQSNLDEIKLRLKRYVSITLVVFLISFFITIAVSQRVGNIILEPVLALAQTAKTVAADKNYSVRVLKTSEDEIGLLVETFNQMLSETQISGDELQKSHNELEHRVQERTSQLETANKEEIRLNRFLDSIIENIPNMVFVKNAGDLRFVRFNKAGEELLGYKREALIGKNDYDFFPKTEADFFTEKDRQVLINRELVDIAEEPIQTNDKGSRILHTKKIPLFDENGVPQYLLGISEDITERKAAESAIKALNQELAHKAAQLQSANKELETFSYSVSHDLRAPLRAIDGFSLALSEDCWDTLGAEGREHLQRIRAASQQMAQLIDDMLNLSRITRGTLNPQEVDLSALAHSIVAELQRSDPARRVTVDIKPDIKGTGDARLIRIALQNLFANAWKFTAKKTDAKIDFSQTVNEQGIKTYCVRDNGAGFDMAYADKLFGPFQRLHSNVDFPGTGVGLATVQRIINRHGGRIWAEGTVNHGAVFYFTL